MAKTKQTRRALWASVLSVMVCAAMLIGTTFAWFTDSVTSGKNTVVAGNLDVELEYATGIDNQTGALSGWKTVQNATDLFADGLWEPGYAQVVYLRVRNAGSLALKYQFSMNILSQTAGVNVAGNTFMLSDYLQYGVAEGQQTAFATRQDAIAAVSNPTALDTYTQTGNLAAGAEPEYVALVVYMPETAGNEANYRGQTAPTIELGLNLSAAQDTVESDSFDNQYDINADYLNKDADGNILISTADDLFYFAKTVNIDHNTYAGQTIKLTADIDLAGRIWEPIGNVVNYPGVTFAGTFDGAKNATENYTIRNMHAVSDTPVYASAGLFGSLTGVVKNVNFENATVESTHYAGVVAGYSSANVGMRIENCHVNGAVITTKVEQLADGTFDNGDKAGGIIGYCVAGDVVTGCFVSDTVITGYRDVGGIAGCAAGIITDNSVSDTTIAQDLTNGYQTTTPTTFGAIVGRWISGYTESGNVQSNVTVHS